MWEFATGNTFGATGEYLGKFCHHLFVIQVGGVIVHLTCECIIYSLGVARRVFSNCATEAEITLLAYLFIGTILLIIVFFLLCSIHLLWCILAFIRGALHPRLGCRRCLQDRRPKHGRQCNWHFPYGLDGSHGPVFVSFSFILWALALEERVKMLLWHRALLTTVFFSQ